MKQKITIAILEDHTLFRQVLANFLSSQKSIRVELQAESFHDLLPLLREVDIDILILDLSLPEIGGEEVQRIINLEFPTIKIIALSIHINYFIINKMFEAGAYAYISKTDSSDELVSAVYSAADNKLYKNRLLTETLYWNKQRKLELSGRSALLNERERTVIQLLWEEKSNEEIASNLYLGVRSVEKIRQDIKEKIGAKSTIGILKFAIANNIIQIISSVI